MRVVCIPRVESCKETGVVAAVHTVPRNSSQACGPHGWATPQSSHQRLSYLVRAPSWSLVPKAPALEASSFHATDAEKMISVLDRRVIWKA